MSIDISVPFGLYLVITNPATSYERCAEDAVRAGIRLIQLRIKNAPRESILAHARNLRSITKGSETIFIVNDNPSIAAEAEADGVHLGQTDGDLLAVRRDWPMLNYFGLSTHSLEQATASKLAQPDYIGVGPVYATPTKAIADPTLGLERASEMIRSVPYPAVAIGGINRENLADVLNAGARNYAVVRDVCLSPDPYSVMMQLQDIWRNIEASRG